MQLNHLNLCVPDVATAQGFFERSFDFRTVEQKGDALAIMTDGQGFTLVLSKMRASEGASSRYPDGFHVGFILASREHVDRTYAGLAAAGAATSGPRRLHGSYAFYFTALGGILFEVACPV